MRVPGSKFVIELWIRILILSVVVQVLREEISRLRRLKSKLEEAREVPSWLQEDTTFQHLLSSVPTLILY
jgi:hypothetical protein